MFYPPDSQGENDGELGVQEAYISDPRSWLWDGILGHTLLVYRQLIQVAPSLPAWINQVNTL